jgi:hypothetical protein
LLRCFAIAVVAVLGASAGCELVLGDLPPARDNPDAGTGGASSSSSAASAGGGCCDCDGDGHLAAGLCGGDDCDDHDPKAYPGEPVYYATADADPMVGFDWDCSGTAERNPQLVKTVNCGLIGLPCTADTGFLTATTAPSCGQSGKWGTCKQQGVGCVEDVIEPNKVMTCK